MKKLTTALCAVLLMILVLMPGAAAAGPALSATRAYCIIDADTGLVLAQQNMNEELHPASITKVMTLALACEKAQGSWDGVKLTVSHEDVHSLAGTDSSHIALQELGLAHTHFANPHGISGDDHYTSCYDMAQILRWALQQPGFETVFTRNEMYTMQPTNLQPVTRYFSQQDKMRIGSSRYHIDGILGSKLGYTNTARYSYACLAEQNGVRLICVTMQSELSTDKYSDVRTLLDDAFATFTGYTELSGSSVTAQLPVAGGGSTLGTVTVADPGMKLLLADGLTAKDVEVSLELPEQYLLGDDPAVYAVYTIRGGTKQESTSVKVPAKISGMADLLAQSTGAQLASSGDVAPGRSAWMLAGISLGCTAAAAVVTVLVMRLVNRIRRKKRRRSRPGPRHGN